MRKAFFLISCVFFISGCAGIAKQWKAFLNDDAEDTAVPKTRAVGATYNQQNEMLPSTYRKYKRTKRKDFEDSAHLEGKSGSLWVMEGQGAYLFSQNIVRMIGDPIAVRLEGDPLEQLNSKAKVISKLLLQLEERRRRALGRGPAGEEKKDKDSEAKPDAKEAPNPAAGNALPTAPGSDDGKDFNVKLVPTRVVDRLVDGNYRVRGTQPFMIGQREYKVIVTGVVRAEDFNDEGIAAPQLLDSNFDIVSSKNSETR